MSNRMAGPQCLIGPAWCSTGDAAHGGDRCRNSDERLNNVLLVRTIVTVGSEGVDSRQVVPANVRNGVQAHVPHPSTQRGAKPAGGAISVGTVKAIAQHVARAGRLDAPEYAVKPDTDTLCNVDWPLLMRSVDKLCLRIYTVHIAERFPQTVGPKQSQKKPLVHMHAR